MKRLPALVCVTSVLILTACSTCVAADWPQFRHDAVSSFDPIEDAGADGHALLERLGQCRFDFAHGRHGRLLAGPHAAQAVGDHENRGPVTKGDQRRGVLVGRLLVGAAG